MSRVILLSLLIAVTGSNAGCRKASKTSTATPSAPSAPTPTASNKEIKPSADDQLMLDYLRIRNEYAELLEKKASEEKIREISGQSSTKLKELQALPRDRQMTVQTKYQKEWDATNLRMQKAIAPGQP